MKINPNNTWRQVEERMGVVWPVDPESGMLTGEETYTGTDGFEGILDRKITGDDIVPLSIQ